MAQPVFSLQAVLDVRHSQVEALEIALSKLLAEERAGRAHQDHLRAQHSLLLQHLQKAMQDELDIVQVNLLRHNLLANETEMQRVQIILNELAGQVAARRGELLKAHQDEEALAILKKKREAVFLNELREKEANQQNDVYIAQSFRQRRNAFSHR